MNQSQMDQQAFEHQFGQKIRQKLSQGSSSLAPATVDRLFEARQHALSRHVASTGELSVVGLGRHFFSLGDNYWRPIAAAIALAAFLVCGDYITSIQRAAELDEVDSALLADDLPINAYLDRGFDTWLNSSAQH